MTTSAPTCGSGALGWDLQGVAWVTRLSCPTSPPTKAPQPFPPVSAEKVSGASQVLASASVTVLTVHLASQCSSRQD